jgi:hypothetical protein
MTLRDRRELTAEPLGPLALPALLLVWSNSVTWE